MDITRARHYAEAIQAKVADCQGKIGLGIWRHNHWIQDWKRCEGMGLKLVLPGHDVDFDDDPDLSVTYKLKPEEILKLLPDESRHATVSVTLSSDADDVCVALSDALDKLLISVPVAISIHESIEELTTLFKKASGWHEADFTIDAAFKGRQGNVLGRRFLDAFYPEFWEELKTAIESP